MARYFAFVLPLFTVIAVSSGLSLDSLQRTLREDDKPKENEITLREYLDALPEPDPVFRSLSRQGWAAAAKIEARRNSDTNLPNNIVPCSSVCGKQPTLPNDDKTCKASKWVPNFIKKGDCECLDSYRCCPDTCAEPDPEVCWENGKKGFKYGIEEVDCCGCKVIKCLDCDAPAGESDTCPQQKPAQCYNYEAQSSHAKKTGCYQSHCEEKPQGHDVVNEVCDVRCQGEATSLSTCLFEQTKCVPNKILSDCPLHKLASNKPKLPLDCYHKPQQAKDPTGGFFLETDICKPCQKWVYEKKSCEPKNTAAASFSCHQYGEDEYDRKCWNKKIVPDLCQCDKAECVFHEAGEVELKFLKGEVCPAGHRKLSGTSICGIARDICKPCPIVIPVKSEDCPYGEVMSSEDANGCPTSICVKATYDKNPIDCAIFTFNQEAKTFQCQEEKEEKK